MNNGNLGLVLLLVALALSFLVFHFHSLVNSQASEACTCTDHVEGGFCPHETIVPWQTYLGVLLISMIAALAVYLMFFEKSQKEVLSELRRQKEMKIDNEKFSILLMGLDVEEQRVLKAVKDQDGITQQTLRFRTDLHKSKLSIVLDGLEKKGLVKKVKKGKTNQVFLKIAL